LKNTVKKVALLMFRYPNGKDKMLVHVHERHLQRFAQRFPDIRLVHCDTVDEFIQNASDAEVLWTLGGGGSRFDLDKVCQHAANLKWACSLLAGTEGFFESKIKDMDSILSNTRGIHGKPMVDHAVALIFGWLRSMPLIVRNQDKAEWKKPPVESLDESEGKTIGIIGLGSIGVQLAAKFKALDFRVVGYKRTPVDCSSVDELYLEGEMDKVLAQSDFVVVTAPLTPQTAGLLGMEQFKQMKKSAVIVNMGRGPIVKTDDLTEALKTRIIAGACLDVTDPEPLPSQHPLWAMPNVIISPHCSANSPNYFDRATEVFCDELDRFLMGKPLMNLVPRDRGY
jgi:phosphoglycerate dehydrogenase-like enzyme